MAVTPTPEHRRAWLAAVADLRDYDHAFLDEEGVKHFGDIFGFIPRTYIAKADPPGTPKGLTLEGGRKSARGLGAHELAMQVCRHFGVAYETKMGRGSQLRYCCDALEAWLRPTA